VATETAYICDADALINLDRHFPKKTREIRRLFLDGLIKIPEGVHRELKEGTDKLARNIDRWSKTVDSVVFWGSNDDLRGKLKSIELNYGEFIVVGKVRYNGFWKSKAGKRSADGQVVTCAKVFSCTVVSNDKAIESVCMLEDIPCIGWKEFARRVGLSESQLDLFTDAHT